ncbi:MAG: Calx-beta domain-containing protein [Microcystis panniformis]
MTLSLLAIIPAVDDILFDFAESDGLGQVNQVDSTKNQGLITPNLNTIGVATTATATVNSRKVPVEKIAQVPASILSFSTYNYTINENGTPVNAVTINREGNTTGAVSVTVNLSNGTATAGNDYSNSPITVNFANGETSKTVNLMQVSKGLSFDGVNDYVNVGAKSSLKVSTAITIEAWINPTGTGSNPSGGGIIVNKEGEYEVARFSDGTIQWAFANSNPGWVWINTGYVAPLNQWTHIAVTYDLGLIKTYANGVLVHIYNGSGTIGENHPDLNDFRIGGRQGQSQFFQGSIDDVRVWNKARPQTEIQADLNRELTGKETSLIGYWNFNAVNNNTVQDLSINQNNGTVFEAQSVTGVVPTSLIINDNIYEPTEIVNLTLSNPTGGATLGTQQTATLTIIDNDAIPGIIQFTNGTYLINENGTPVTPVTLYRTNGSDGAVSVTINLNNGTATAGSDYNNSPITVNFANGETSKIVTIPIVNDNQIEADETLNLTLSNPQGGATLGNQTTATVTIINDDTSVTLAVAPSSVIEDGTTNLVYTFTRTGVISNALTVNYTVGGTATFNTDYTQSGAASYTGTTGTATFAPNSTTVTVTIDPTADTTFEPDETIVLTLTSGTGYMIGTTTPVTGTIVNDDTIVTLTVSPNSVTEDGTSNLIYTFTRTGVTTNALTVSYSIGGTATLNTDYTRSGTNNTVTFAPNSTTATVIVDPTADTTIESNETVALTLTAGTGYTVGTTTAVTGTITNDDLSQLSINDITVVEGKDNNAILTVTVDNPNPQQISVNYATEPIDATANVDYTSKTGTITIAPNTSTATISIPILNDNLNEPDESFAVTLSNPTNAIINPDGATGEVIITDTWQSSFTRTLPNGVENLKLIGTKNINGTGNNANNTITGNSGNNQINGRAGIDTLTGGLGADTFIFQFGQSTISTSDSITDFAINSDKIDLLTQGGLAMNAPSSFSRAANSTVTTLQNLINQVFTDANGATTGNQGLAVNSAALVQVTTGAIAGTYLVINDSAAGFQSSNDLLINITGFTGTLPALGNIPVGNFFI